MYKLILCKQGDHNMRAYKFTTKVSDSGTITIPKYARIQNKEVEVIIQPKENSSIQKSKARDFINKWAGFLSNDKTDESKAAYLSEKYQ